MIIKKIKINGFGNLENKEINFNKHINIISGKNEAGKSTLLKFISSMLYGVNRNKNGKEITDYEKYKPWNVAEYSGKLSYQLDNDAHYEIYRDFNKKNPKLYNEKAEDITKQYSVDKNRGSEFFKEQTGIEEELLMATNVISQEEMKLDKTKQNLLIQKITNLISTGEDNISYKKASDKLAKKLLEEVGTDRTTERPINIIENKIKQLENNKKELEENKTKKIALEETNKKIKQEQNEKIKNLAIIKEIKNKKQEEKIEEEIIKVNEKSLEEIKNKKQKNEENKDEGKDNKNSKKYILIFSIFLILTVASILSNMHNAIKYILIIIDIIYLIFMLLKNKKIKNKKEQEKNKIKKENEIIENLILEKTEEIKKLKLQKEEKINSQKIKIKNQYQIPEKIVEDYFAFNMEELENLIEKRENEIKLDTLKIHEIELENKTILTKLEQAAQIEEELQNLYNKKQNLNSLSHAIQIAKQTLEEAYDEMKNSITPTFTKQLSKAAQKISSGKYQNVIFNDEEGLRIEKQNGEYISANLLSTGTIDQMYFSLRLSVASQISTERVPIILDEAFVYYDAERLENALQYLDENYKEYQILILTCSTREKEALDRLQIPYHEIIM